jgi:hypothetical protein
MELIPVLSTIILVATICTFLLAIGAYILYKIRESKGLKSAAPEPATVKADLYTPYEVPVQVPKSGPEIAPQPVYYQSGPAPVFQRSSESVADQQTTENRFQKYTSEGYVNPSNEEKSEGQVKWK